MALELPAQALQLAAGQHGLAVLPAQVVLLLHQLALLLLQQLHLLLGVPMLLQLRTGKASKCRGGLFPRDPGPLPTPAVNSSCRTLCGRFTHCSDNPEGPIARIQKWALGTSRGAKAADPSLPLL